MSEKNRAKEYYKNNRDILNRAKEYYIKSKSKNKRLSKRI